MDGQDCSADGATCVDGSCCGTVTGEGGPATSICSITPTVDAGSVYSISPAKISGDTIVPAVDGRFHCNVRPWTMVSKTPMSYVDVIITIVLSIAFVCHLSRKNDKRKEGGYQDSVRMFKTVVEKNNDVE